MEFSFGEPLGPKYFACDFEILPISDLAGLEAKENRLDDMIRQCTNQLRVMTEDAENSRLAYVNYHDIRSIKSFEEQTVIAIKAPPETRLEVPDPNQVRNIKDRS